MNNEDRSTPAFPRPYSSSANAQSGMSMREYLAAMAMQSLVATMYSNSASAPVMNSFYRSGMNLEDWIAKEAYGCADAMLAAGEQLK